MDAVVANIVPSPGPGPDDGVAGRRADSGRSARPAPLPWRSAHPVAASRDRGRAAGHPVPSPPHATPRHGPPGREGSCMERDDREHTPPDGPSHPEEPETAANPGGEGGGRGEGSGTLTASTLPDPAATLADPPP